MNKLAETIIQKLKNNGFILQLYEATSTNSTYLKLDYGVANSIRIANHPGKKYLKYRYNIGPHITKYEKEIIIEKGKKLKRYYYPENQIEKMIQDIIEERNTKKEKYGEYQYIQFMEKNKKEHHQQKGFWKDAKLLT